MSRLQSLPFSVWLADFRQNGVTEMVWRSCDWPTDVLLVEVEHLLLSLKLHAFCTACIACNHAKSNMLQTAPKGFNGRCLTVMHVSVCPVGSVHVCC